MQQLGLCSMALNQNLYLNTTTGDLYRVTISETSVAVDEWISYTGFCVW